MGRVKVKLKNYSEASSFPLVNIGKIPVPMFILGHLPLIGESYQGVEKNLEYRRKFSDAENIAAILTKAVKKGITVMAAAASEELQPKLFLKAVKKTAQGTRTEIALIPCVQIPLKIQDKPVDDYRRWATYYQIEKSLVDEDVLNKYLEDPVLQCREKWKERFKQALTIHKPYSDKELKKLKVDYGKLGKALRTIKEFRILFIEFGSETDFLALTGKIELLEELSNRLKDAATCPVLLGIHHAGSSIPILDKTTIEFHGYMTPVNKLGVMMFPTQNKAVEAIRKSRKPIIAIKPLAGGRIQPKEAFPYVYRDLKIPFCMVGAGSERELNEDLSRVRETLGLKQHCSQQK